MKMTIRGNKVEITEAMKTHIESKLSKLDKYFENPDEIEACNCGQYGCLEQYASATGIVRLAKKRF